MNESFHDSLLLGRICQCSFRLRGGCSTTIREVEGGPALKRWKHQRDVTAAMSLKSWYVACHRIDGNV